MKRRFDRPHTGRGNIPQDVIALGPKQKSNDGGRSLGDLGMMPIKKQKANASASSPSHYQRVSPVFPEPDVTYVDVPFQDLVSRVIDENDFDLVNGMLCGAIKHLRSNRSKPDQILYCSLFTLARERPGIFTSTVVVESLVCLLKKDVSIEYIKSKGNSLSSIIACSLLMHAFEISYTWPPILIKVFMDDSLGDRIWVDHPKCQSLVKNICTAFGTEFSKINLSPDDKKSGSDDPEQMIVEREDYPLRFSAEADIVVSYALDSVKERMGRRQGSMPMPSQDAMGAQSRNLLRTLTAMCGMPEVRLLASQKLEMWFQNPKLVKATQDLILGICVNSKHHLQEDVDVISHLIKMRVKNKANLNSYIQCLKELVRANPKNISTLFQYLVYNELSTSRNPINMSIISAMLHFKPIDSAKKLAVVWQDLLLQQDDYLRASRGLIREIVRSSKHSVHFPSLIMGFLQEPVKEKFSKLDHAHKVRFVNSTVDIACLLMLVSISPAVKEVLIILKSQTADLTDEQLTLYVKHKTELAEMQCASMWWLQSVAVQRLLHGMTQNEFMSHIQKLLFLKPSDGSYHSKDNWPPESDRNFVLKACGDVPVLEDTIVRLAMIGLSNELPVPPAEVLEVIHLIVKRAAGLERPGFNPLPIENLNIMEMLLSLSQYHHPENIQLPANYVPPSLAILVHYWTVWRVLLILSAFNPGTIGYQGWTQYPILKNFMEMSIINNFAFPPATIIDEHERSVLISKEQQMVQIEKNEILEFESHLAAATTHLAVTEETSLLLTQLIAMDATGTARRPPDAALNLTKTLCKDLLIGPWLCRSRNPDFLLDIINRHGDNQQMPWLAGVVSSARGDMGMLPVQCLCEFLLAGNTGQEPVLHKEELVERLYNILASDKIEEASQVIRYFIHRLQLPQLETRITARQALSSICSYFPDVISDLNSPNIPEFNWLISKVECIPIYQFIKKEASDEIQRATKCETDPLAVVAYIVFLSKSVVNITPEIYADNADLIQAIALTVSQVLIDRPILVDTILSHDDNTVALIFINSILKIFFTLMSFVRKRPTQSEDQSEEIPWRDTQDEIFVRWPSGGVTAQLHIYVSQAIVLLLTYGCPSNYKRNMELQDCDDLYVALMNDWFSVEGYTIPKAYLMDTQEEAILLPDWLRVKMLHCATNSETLRLTIAACQDLDLKQLLLCIQSFGIQVPTIDRLLSALDQYAIKNPEQVTLLTKDNSVYMTRLVESHWKRGCQHGRNFVQLLSALTAGRPSVIQLTPGSTENDIVDLTDERNEAQMEVEEKPSIFIVNKIKKESVKSYLNMDEMLENLKSNNRERAFKDIFKMLQRKKVTKDEACKVIAVFSQQIKNDVNCKFSQGILNSGHRGSCLLQILHNKLHDQEDGLDSMETETATMRTAKTQFQEMVEILCRVPNPNSGVSNVVLSLLKSWSAEGRTQDKSSSASSELHQSHWARLEEFLKQQLSSLGKNEKVKEKVELVAQILLEEIGSRKTKVGRGNKDANDDKFYASIGTTGLLMDWLQLLDPELLAHNPMLQRKLVFELQKAAALSMPIKMTAKMSANNKLSHSLSAHQTYLLSLLTDHCNWRTVHKCLEWLLSDAAVENSDKIRDSKVIVDPNTAMDFLWVCIHMSKIWRGRENKSSCLKEPVLYLNTSQFCQVLTMMVASTNKRSNHPRLLRNENSHVDMFLLYFNKFGQASASDEQIEEIVKFIYHKSLQQSSSEIWRSILAQIFLLQPYNVVWDKQIESNVDNTKYISIPNFFQAIMSSETSSLCHMDLLVEKLLDKLGYVREKDKVSTDNQSQFISSGRDEAYDSSLLLRKLASSRPAVILRQLPLIVSMLTGRTRYEFQEFKHKNHLLFMSQLGEILEIIGPQLFQPEYKEHILVIVEKYLQIVKNYCARARKQTKDIMYCCLRLVVKFLSKSPNTAYPLLMKYSDTLNTLTTKVYKDHEDVIAIVNTILSNVSSISMSVQSTSTQELSFLSEKISNFESEHSRATLMKFLNRISKTQDLENVAEALNEMQDPSVCKTRDLSVFLPELVRLFSTSADSSIRHTALSLSMQVLKFQPAYAMKIILPAYINCLKCYGSDPSLTSETSESFLTPNSIDTDLIARDALTYLQDIVVLCREKAVYILQLAFEAGSKQAVGIQPTGALGNVGTSLVPGSQMSWSDLDELISKALLLLLGSVTATNVPKLTATNS